MSTGRLGGWRGTSVRRGLLLSVAATLLVVGGALLAQGRVLLHQCVSVPTGAARLGLELALLRSVDDCPDGAFGFGAAPRGAVLLLSVAVPALAVHVALVACGLGLGAVVRRGVRAAVALLRRVLLPAAARAAGPVAARLRAAGDFLLTVAPTTVLLVAGRHRGPPAVA